jgi:hypothetical protein
VTQPPVTADIHQAFDIHSNLAAEVAFNPHFLVDDVAQAVDFVIRQVSNPCVRVDTGSSEKLLARV